MSIVDHGGAAADRHGGPGTTSVPGAGNADRDIGASRIVECQLCGRRATVTVWLPWYDQASTVCTECANAELWSAAEVDVDDLPAHVHTADPCPECLARTSARHRGAPRAA